MAWGKGCPRPRPPGARADRAGAGRGVWRMPGVALAGEMVCRQAQNRLRGQSCKCLLWRELQKPVSHNVYYGVCSACVSSCAATGCESTRSRSSSDTLARVAS